MEISKEVKAIVFTQYIGQYICKHKSDRVLFRLAGIDITRKSRQLLVYGDWSGGTNPEASSNDWVDFSDIEFELKPLSAITDEDKRKCYHMNSANIGYDYTQDFKPFIEMANHLTKMEGDKWLYKYSDCFQFLQSRGYDLPNFHLNGRTLQECGLAIYNP